MAKVLFACDKWKLTRKEGGRDGEEGGWDGRRCGSYVFSTTVSSIARYRYLTHHPLSLLIQHMFPKIAR